MSDLVVSLVRGTLRRLPFLKPTARGLADALLRVLLTPLGRSRPSGRPIESADLVARTDELNRAAEGYFANYEDRAFLLDKPFSDRPSFAKRLFDMGVLFDRLQVRPGDVVVELGAGSCWVSHFLNRFGCKTIAIDVSSTALEVGRELFERDPATRWELEPQFLAYDGHRLPLPDGACDGIVINDAFHHVPNQRELLTEMARVLVEDGRVAMCEPGMEHSSSEESVREVEETGVLENDLIVEDLAALAVDCGFAGVNVAVSGPRAVVEVPAARLGSFTRGWGFRPYWMRLCEVLEEGHYLVLYKHAPLATTRRPRQLTAEIRIERPRRKLRLSPGQAGRLRVAVRNPGDTRWLAAPDEPGWTRLGAHLHPGGHESGAAPAGPVDFDWYRAELPGDLDPEESVRLDLELPPLTEPGLYRVELDLVVEGVTWFAERGSKTATVELEVG